VNGAYGTPTIPDGSDRDGGTEMSVAVTVRPRVTLTLLLAESLTVNCGLELPTGVEIEGFPVREPFWYTEKPVGSPAADQV